MVFDGQELCLCGSPRSHYCVCYAELHGEDAETRGGNNSHWIPIVFTAKEIYFAQTEYFTEQIFEAKH